MSIMDWQEVSFDTAALDTIISTAPQMDTSVKWVEESTEENISETSLTEDDVEDLSQAFSLGNDGGITLFGVWLNTDEILRALQELYKRSEVLDALENTGATDLFSSNKDIVSHYTLTTLDNESELCIAGGNVPVSKVHIIRDQLMTMMRNSLSDDVDSVEHEAMLSALCALDCKGYQDTHKTVCMETIRDLDDFELEIRNRRTATEQASVDGFIGDLMLQNSTGDDHER